MLKPIAPPTYSPWDDIQQKKKLHEGVYWVSTAGHGGLMVHCDVAESALTAEARNAGMLCTYSQHMWYAYEEDCKWAIPFYERPEWLRESQRQNLASWQKIVDDPRSCYYQSMRDEAPAHVAAITAKLAMSDADLIADQRLLRTISMWDAEYLLARGIKPDAEGYAEFCKSRENDRRRAAHDPDLIVSATSGTSWEPVPAGQMKVTTADHKEHFVTDASYPPADGSYLLSHCTLAPVGALEV